MVLFIIKSATIVELKYLKYLSLPFFAILHLNLLSLLYLSRYQDHTMPSQILSIHRYTRMAEIRGAGEAQNTERRRALYHVRS